MAPLSHQLSELVIPHDSLGSHLNVSRQTIDEELEIRNFEAAGNILAQVWNTLIIDGEKVVAEYINPKENLDESGKFEFSHDWYRSHVQESQYLLQIRKCNDKSCCSKYRSDLRTILPSGFLPPPCPLQQGNLLSIPSPKDDQDGSKFCPLFVRLTLNYDWSKVHPNFKFMPYDFFCPSLAKVLVDRVCKLCGQYFASKKTTVMHKKIHGKDSARTHIIQPISILKRRQGRSLCILEQSNNFDVAEWLDDEDIDVEFYCESEASNDEPSVPLVGNLPEWLQNAWTADE